MSASFDVKANNVQALFALRVGLERNTIETCRTFGLPAEAAERLRAMPLDQLLGWVDSLGSLSLLVPRSDFLDLIEMPLPLAATLAAAHPVAPAADHAA